MKTFSLIGLILLLSGAAQAGSVSGTLGISITILDTSLVSSQVPSGGVLRSLSSLSVLTEAADGAVVDVLINNQKITSVRSDNGVVHFELNLTDSENIDLELRSAGKPLQALQTAYSAKTSVNPKMSVDSQSQRRQVVVTNADGSKTTRTVEVRNVLVEY